MGETSKYVAREGSLLVLRALATAVGGLDAVNAMEPDEALTLAWRCYLAQEAAHTALRELIEGADMAIKEIMYPSEPQDDRKPFGRGWGSMLNDEVLIATENLAQVRNEVRRKRPGWVER